MNTIKTSSIALLCAVSALAATGCAPILIGGAAVGTATVMTDRRTTGNIVSDEVIEKRVLYEITQALNNDKHHITVTSYEGRVLLTGEVGSPTDRRAAQQIASISSDVRSVVNELAVMDVSSVGTRLSDSLLATKVRTAIIGTDKVSLNQMKVTVDRGIVYLMGVVTSEEAQRTAKRASEVSGVAKVVTVFNIVTQAEIDRRMKDLNSSSKVDASSAQ